MRPESREEIAEQVAFIDDSSGAQEGKILLLSACIQSVSVWSQFSNDWQVGLDEKPSIPNFHMREARPLKGAFQGWKAIDRDLKIISLTNIVLRHEPHVISCWMNVSDYNELVRSVSPADLSHAYHLCFHTIVYKVAEYQHIRGITTPVDYVFDDQGDIGNEAILWYAAIKESAPPHIRSLMGSTPVFRNDEQVLPLQAADIIAWHKRRKKEITGLDPEVAATMRVDELPGGEVHIDKESLKRIAKDIAKVPNVADFHEVEYL